MAAEFNISKLPAKLQQNEYLKIYLENKHIRKSEAHLLSLSSLVLSNVRVRQHHIEFLQSAVQEFQAEIIRYLRAFDVYDFIGRCTGHSGFTVRKWFNDNDESGTKLGTEDFLAICFVIDNVKPADILLYDAQTLCSASDDLNLDIPLQELSETMLRVLYGSGRFIEKFTQEFSKAATDGIIDCNEKKKLTKCINENIEILQQFLVKLNQGC